MYTVAKSKRKRLFIMKAKELRKRAWDALKGRYWWALLAALIAWVFGAISMGYSSASSASAQHETEVSNWISSQPTALLVAVFIFLIGLLVVCIVMTIASSAIKLGYNRFNMDLFTEVDKPGMNILFSRTGIIWKALWMSILIGLKTFLWALLFIVPGIIAAYRYSQADFILAENPDLTAMEAINKSKEMMKGQKWSKFCLDLSFIGWYLLAAIVPAGFVFLTPYVETADAAFYLDRTGRLGDRHENLNDLEAKA